MSGISTSLLRLALAWTAGLGLDFLGQASPAQAEEMQEVTFIVVSNMFSAPAFVAAENGYWAQQGLNVKIKLTS
jgi:ABC-type nitrate/sulfonate/bicarbonate transport system substrate-binding protein